MPSTIDLFSTNPKLRPVEPQWIQYQGRSFVQIKDPLRLADKTILVPEELAPLITLTDGTRDVLGLQASLLLQAGTHVSQEDVRSFIVGLDDGYLLDNENYKEAVASVLNAYHNADNRPLSHAGSVYPGKRAPLITMLNQYEKDVSDIEPLSPPGRLTGLVSPHIDFQRGGDTYARLWRRCSGLLSGLELVVILGTDHAGSPGSLTLTRQSYSTPFGTLPTDREIVNMLAEVIGEEAAFGDEIHHINEHSIELSAVWLHRNLGKSVPIVPILCGSFYELVTSDRNVGKQGHLDDAIDKLSEVISKRKTLVIAAGDLSHVGPVFGDPMPIDRGGRSRLATEDARSINAINAVDAEGFLDISRTEKDSRKICGLPPIYLALKLLQGSKAESFGYSQCPADSRDESFVSIVGSIFWD